MEDERDLRVRVCGLDLRVRWFAPQQGPEQPVIVFLHQGLGSVTQWRDFPERLARATGCAVVAYDRWGHGASERIMLPRPADFLNEEAERALPELLNTLGIGKAILYGHSDGGSIALLFGAAYPEITQAIISEAAHVFSEANSAEGFAQVIAAYETGDLRERLARHHGDKVDSMFRGWADFWRSPAAQGWRMTDRLSQIRCPVLVIQGDRDNHGSPEQVDAIVSGVGGPVESWFVPGCGHSPHLEATDAVVERVSAFVGRVVSDA